MQRTNMLEGQQYVVEKIGVATYAGVHDGLLVAADGTEFYGGKGSLRFVVAATEDKPQRVVLIADGRDVIESVETQRQREKEEAQREQVRSEVVAEARAMLENYGIPIADKRGQYSEVSKGMVRINDRVMWEKLDDVELGAFTAGHLLQVIGQVTMDNRRAIEQG